MSNKKGIGFSPLTEKVYIGKQNKEKGMWIGDKEDITSEFLAIMFQYVPPNTSRTISTNGVGSNVFFNLKKDKKSIEDAIKYFQKMLEDEK